MADYIPFDIQVEIIKRLPIKSLIQFRYVSKPWKSLIDSSKFIAPVDYKQKYVLIADDDTFPQHKFSLNVSMYLKQFYEPCIIGSSQGLFCFIGYCYSEKPDDKTAILCNPSIRKPVSIAVPNVLNHWLYGNVIGFGVCPHTNDPKLVKINYNVDPLQIDTISCIPWLVEVFTLSSRIWRSPLCSNLPRKSIKFTEIFVPGSVSHYPGSDLPLSKLRESFVVLEYNYEVKKPVYGVWMMEHGVPNAFTNLFNINAPGVTIERVLGFRKSGEPIFGMRIDSQEQDALSVYEPYSQHVNHIGISVRGFSHKAIS